MTALNFAKQGKFIDIDFVNADKVIAAMNQLPVRLQNGAIKSGLRKAGNLVRDDARRRAPHRSSADRKYKGKRISKTKSLRNRIRTISRRGTRHESIVSVVAQAPHSHLIEYGTVNRVQDSTGRFTGHVKARPFMRPALRSKQPEIMSVMNRGVADYLRKKLV